MSYAHDFLSQIESDAGAQFSWKAHTKRGEYCGPCPRCGGQDRFVVWPEHPSGSPEFMCRQCTLNGKAWAGDAVEYLRDHHGLPYTEARVIADGWKHTTPGPRPRLEDQAKKKNSKQNGNGMHGGGQRPEEITTYYVYTDAEENPIARVVRVDYRDADGERTKSIYQQVPNGRGGWKNGGPKQHVPYALSLVMGAREKNLPVFVVEGEKCVHALWDTCHFPATTNMNGALSWQDELTPYFAGLEVYIIPDQDTDGHKHAQQVARKLRGTAAHIYRLELPLPFSESHGLDIVDYLQEHSPAELEKLIIDAPEWLPEPDPEPTADGPEAAPPDSPESSEEHSPAAASAGKDEHGNYHLTDTGNAFRLIDLHGHRLRYSPALGWLVYDGRRWKAVGREAVPVRQLAWDVITQLYDEVVRAGKAGDQKRADSLLSHAGRTQQAQRITAMIELAKAVPGVLIQPDQLDAHPHLLNVHNGTLDLQTGQLREHRAEDYFTQIAPVEYDPTAQAPRWQGFLSQIMGGDSSLVDYLQAAVGHTLTGDVSEQALFLCHGTGANGKSTFLEVVKACMGEGYSMQASVAVFLADARPSETRSTLAAMKGARLVCGSEADEGKRFNASLVKQLTGGDTIRARQLYQEEYEFKPTHHIWIAVNHKPKADASDEAIWRRMRLIPFTVRIPEVEQDKHLKEKLLEELPGILTWAVAGAVRWYRDGLPTPPAVRAATEEYREEQDDIAAFLEARVMLRAGASTRQSLVYAAFVAWCKAELQMDERRVMNIRAFNKRLTEKGYQQIKSTGGFQFWQGVVLTDSGPSDGGPDQDEMGGSERKSGESGQSGRLSQTFSISRTREEVSENSQLSPLHPLDEFHETSKPAFSGSGEPGQPGQKQPAGPLSQPRPHTPPVDFSDFAARPGLDETFEVLRQFEEEKQRRAGRKGPAGDAGNRNT